jgi:predicted 3-demethylubiquinone-9 3-methyltransferase (glyoxalase superfamily)
MSGKRFRLHPITPAVNRAASRPPQLTVLGQAFVGLNGGPVFTPNVAVSFQVMTDDQTETDHYSNAIIENGGSESQCDC